MVFLADWNSFSGSQVDPATRRGNIRGMPRLRPSLSSLILLPALLMLAMLSACATVGGNRVVWVGVDGDNDCRIDAAGEPFALPADEARLAERLRRLARGSRSALIGPPPARTSPGCWDAAVALVRAAGFARIGFFSNEPSDDARTG